MVSREDDRLVYDLPRIEETWSVQEWRDVISPLGLKRMVQTIALLGLEKSFSERRITGQNLMASIDGFSDDPRESVNKEQSRFIARVWTMPDRVLRTVSATHPGLAGQSRN